jgi:hypothetical protein
MHICGDQGAKLSHPHVPHKYSQKCFPKKIRKILVFPRNVQQIYKKNYLVLPSFFFFFFGGGLGSATKLLIPVHRVFFRLTNKIIAYENKKPFIFYTIDAFFVVTLHVQTQTSVRHSAVVNNVSLKNPMIFGPLCCVIL